MHKVNIILTTYNGANYLKQLLDSLFNQTYQNIDIFVRDDGSSDSTNEIIEEYVKKNNSKICLHIISDDLGNLGYVGNFLRTIRMSGDADYYAFCDQDDYWLPDKIERAVKALDELPSDRLLLFSSAYETCDGDLNNPRRGHEPTPIEELDVGKCLSLYDGGWLLGFTLVLNKALKNKAFDNDAQKMYSHDIWVQAVLAGFAGELIYDAKPTVFFRRHQNTASIAESGVSNSLISTWRYRWAEGFGNGTMFLRIKNSIATYAAEFGGNLEKKRDAQFIEVFTKSGRISKLLYPHRLKQNISAELAWRFAILLGKI